MATSRTRVPCHGAARASTMGMASSIGQERDELAGQSRTADIARHVALQHAAAHEEAKPAPQGGQVAGHRDGIEAAAVEMGEVGTDQPASTASTSAQPASAQKRWKSSRSVR